MEKEIKNIKFDFQGKGKLKKTFGTPFGNIWVNSDDRVWYFDGEDEALEVLKMLTEIGASLDIDKADALNFVLHTFRRLCEEDVRIVGDNIFFVISIQGELEPIVNSTFGVLYADFENKVWYFKAAHEDSLIKAGLDFRLFLDATKEHAEKEEEAKALIALMKEYTLLNAKYFEED